MTAKKRTARYATTTRRRPTTQQAEAEPSPEPDADDVQASTFLDPPRTTSRALGDALTWDHVARPRELNPEPGPDAYEYSAADDASAMAGMDNDDDPGSEVLSAKPTVLVGADAAKALLPGNVYMLFKRDAIAAVAPGYIKAPNNSGKMVPSKTVLEVTLTSGQVWYVCGWPGGCTRGENGAPYVSDNPGTVVSHQSTHSNKSTLRREAAVRRAEELAAGSKTKRRYAAGVSASVLEFITEHVDNLITTRTIAKHTGHAEKSVRSALTAMRNHSEEGRKHLQTFRRNGTSYWVWYSDATLMARRRPPEPEVEPPPPPPPPLLEAQRSSALTEFFRRANAAFDLMQPHRVQPVQYKFPDAERPANPEGTTELPEYNDRTVYAQSLDDLIAQQRAANPEFDAAYARTSRSLGVEPEPIIQPNDVGGHRFTYVGKTSQGVMLVRDESTDVIYRLGEVRVVST